MKPGDKLWWVEHDRRRSTNEGHEVVVVSVGRKWAVVRSSDGGPHAATSRVDMSDGCVDGGQYSSPAKCWPSREAYTEYRRPKTAWDEFRRTLEHEYSPPEGITVERIEHARRILLGLPEPQA